MGKRSGGLTGLSGFLNALKDETPSRTGTVHEQKPQEITPEASDGQPPTKKRKKSQRPANGSRPTANGKTSWVEKYSATGLVPHYSHPSEVPDHLQKCASAQLGPSYFF